MCVVCTGLHCKDDLVGVAGRARGRRNAHHGIDLMGIDLGE